MGRFHRHDDGTTHSHDHAGAGHSHEHGSASGDHGADHSGDHSAGHSGDHSGYRTGTQRIEVLEAVFAENDQRAEVNRKAFQDNHVRALNLMSSPGSGKTTVLAATLDELAGELAVGVVEGDIATDLDAEKLGGRGAQISLLNTSNGFGGECHLDAPMVNRALAGLDLPALDLVIIENVGNLVCPAEFDVGEHVKAMVYSVTEGEDKPLKYPVMFRSVDVVLLNKIDLLPHLDADLDTYLAAVRQVNPTAIVLPVSARTGEGMAAWFDWLRRFAAPAGTGPGPARYAVVEFTDPDAARAGFEALLNDADAGVVDLLDVQFVRSIAGVPSTVPGGRVDPALGSLPDTGLLSQADLDGVAADMRHETVAAVVLYTGGRIEPALAAWDRDGAVVRGGPVDHSDLEAARSGTAGISLLRPAAD